MRRAVLPLALLLPVACAQTTPDPAEALQDALASHQANMAGIAGVPLPPAAAPRAAAPAAILSDAGPSTASPSASGPMPSMAVELVGQTPDAVVRWLGEPRLRREEGPAEIWHYQATQCHLDIVLYREEGSQPVLRVAFAAARAVGTARRGEAACLRDIARGAARPGAPGSGDLARLG